MDSPEQDPQPPDPDPEGSRAPPSEKEKREQWIPRPPKGGNSSDFIVIVFSITVATILVILTVGTVIAGIVGRDISSYFAILTSIMTSMISALVGYLAGKGVGHTEAAQQQQPPPPPGPML
jgi:hypothetical protein